MDETEAPVYKAAVEVGQLRRIVQCLTSRKGRGVCHMDNLCSKAGFPMGGVVWEKHTAMQDPVFGVEGKAFELYEKVLWPIPIQVTVKQVKRVAS